MAEYTDVHETVRHRPDDGNATRLGQRKSCIVILKQNDRLLV